MTTARGTWTTIRTIRLPGREQEAQMARRAHRFDRDVDGILLLDKPVGVSSNAALQRARALFRARKAGHCGSLDPLASGMLPVCFGQATKISGWLLEAAKTYRASLVLGVQTDTGDTEGHVVAEGPVPLLDEASVRGRLAGLVGEREQVPPMYSALKQGGQRLYRLARMGLTVERRPRQVRIHRLEILGIESGRLDFEVHCSKGTYVRTLGEDIARSLGTVGHLKRLRRTAVEPFSGAALVTFEALDALSAGCYDDLASVLLPADAAFSGLPRVDLDAEGSRRLLQGQTVQTAQGLCGLVRVYGPDGRFVGLVESGMEGRLRPRRLFVTGSS